MGKSNKEVSLKVTSKVSGLTPQFEVVDQSADYYIVKDTASPYLRALEKSKYEEVKPPARTYSYGQRIRICAGEYLIAVVAAKTICFISPEGTHWGDAFTVGDVAKITQEEMERRVGWGYEFSLI